MDKIPLRFRNRLMRHLEKYRYSWDSVVLVHPWYEQDNINQKFPIWDGKYSEFLQGFLEFGESPDYLSNLNYLLSNFSGKFFVLEETKNMVRTKAKILGRTKNAEFFETAADRNEPINSNFSRLANLVNENGGHVWFAGGQTGALQPYLRNWNQKAYYHNGCLGNCFDELRKKGVKGRFLRGCCFS